MMVFNSAEIFVRKNEISLFLSRFRKNHYICSMIEFMTEGIEMPSLDQAKVMLWIEEVARRHHRRVGRIRYSFCDDDYILDANRTFVNHDYYTDIITFDYSEDREISGDILISLDTVNSNARMIGEGSTRELLRVIIHGVLHLCGIDDKGPGEREIMEHHENEALDIYPF